MRKEEVESALAKQEYDELSWIQRLLKTCSNCATNRRENVIGPMMAAVPPEPPRSPDVKTDVHEVCKLYTALSIFLAPPFSIVIFLRNPDLLVCLFVFDCLILFVFFCLFVCWLVGWLVGF